MDGQSGGDAGARTATNLEKERVFTLKNRVYELKNTRNGHLDKARKALEGNDQEGYNASMAEVAKLNAEIEQTEALQAEAGRFEDGDSRMATLHDVQNQRRADAALTTRADAARSGSEYTRAFAAAISNGITLKNGRGDEQYAPLYAALTETGGVPEGADGGFLVPIDFDYTINELQRALTPLSGVFGQELVNTLTGWRVMDNVPGNGFEKVDEMAEVPINQQPSFRRIDYRVVKYGLIVPVSRELLDDNAANLMSYLARWFAKKATITENTLLLALLAKLTPKPVTIGDEVKAIKRALNVTLDPAISPNAVILTNQAGFSAMDELDDGMGRPLMQPDVQNPTSYRLLGRRIIIVPDRFLASSGNTAPVYIGDMKQYGTLFRRKAFELASTDIGGNAWRTDSVETRGLMRLDARTFDEEAATALAMPIA